MSVSEYTRRAIDLTYDRVICAKCPAVAKVHSSGAYQLNVWVDVECHGVRQFMVTDQFYRRLSSAMDRPVLIEDMRPISRKDLDEWVSSQQNALARATRSYQELSGQDTPSFVFDDCEAAMADLRKFISAVKMFFASI